MNNSKDFIKFRQHIRTLNLKVNEQYLLELLFEYHNTQYGYAFPKFSHILEAFNTTSKNRISITIRKLEKKGVIKVDRTFINNRYYIVGIEEFINSNNPKNKPNQDKPKDSIGKPPIDGQVHITELEEITEDQQTIMDLSKVTQKQAKRLLQLGNDNTSKVIDYIKYALKRGIESIYPYVRKLIKVNAKIGDTNVYQGGQYKNNGDPNVPSCATNAARSYNAGTQYKKSIPFIENFKGRNYSDAWYKDIENQLLGWE